MSKTNMLINFCNRILPKKDHITISGYPSDEGNVIETIRVIHDLTTAKINVLVDDPNIWDLEKKYTRVRLMKKNSAKGVYSYLTSQLVLFTHGLFGSIEPVIGKQIYVNLWHGDGIKQKPEFSHLETSPFPANYTVGTSRVLADQRAVDLRYSESSVIMTGAPRLGAMLRTDACNKIKNRLSEITGFEKYVIWMPTFRTAGVVGRNRARFDSSITESGFASALNDLREILHSQDTALVGKFHPLEKNSMASLVDLTISAEMLDQLESSLYLVIGGSSGLVTDYSSVWIEYLILDRPIAFFTPDLEEYTSRRGLFPHDIMDRLPGLNLNSTANISQFAYSIEHGGEELLRASTRTWLGIPQISDSPASDLVNWLSKLPELRELLIQTPPTPIMNFGPVFSRKTPTLK
ncbi:CDP-glycerol glycerophosphotransferase [Arthrobacter sp. UYCu511]|uniref:CDP-glycerol glycerophosphotransferase family protein n=1 Tax=Arthrobacter sp. UYCu511 TaxID=3156337 RepID=UPI0033978029